MDGTKQGLDRIRRIERRFEATRTAPQQIAVAYENVLPVVRRCVARQREDNANVAPIAEVRRLAMGV